MPATALIQARIDPAIRDEAAAVLDRMGMTVSDAVRILLTLVANEGALPAGLTVDPSAHDAWFRAKVMEALDSRRSRMRTSNSASQPGAPQPRRKVPDVKSEAAMEPYGHTGPGRDFRIHRAA